MSLYSPRLGIHTSSYEKDSLKVGFGFDDSRDTYKVVAILLDSKSQETEVRVHCLGDTCWRKILTCPAFHILQKFDGSFASETLNWLALRTSSSDYEWDAVTTDQLVIFSYLKDETYKYLLMHDGLSQVPYVEPCVSVLKGCLCLSHDHNETHFIVWIMREFGVDKSLTQLLNISYKYFEIQLAPAMPSFMSENEDVLFLADEEYMQFIVYNMIYNRIDSHYFKDYSFGYLSYEYVLRFAILN